MTRSRGSCPPAMAVVGGQSPWVGASWGPESPSPSGAVPSSACLPSSRRARSTGPSCCCLSTAFPAFYQQAAGGFVATMIAVGASATDLELNPSRVITTGIVHAPGGGRHHGRHPGRPHRLPCHRQRQAHRRTPQHRGDHRRCGRRSHPRGAARGRADQRHGRRGRARSGGRHRGRCCPRRGRLRVRVVRSLSRVGGRGPGRSARPGRPAGREQLRGRTDLGLRGRCREHRRGLLPRRRHLPSAAAGRGGARARPPAAGTGHLSRARSPRRGQGRRPAARVRTRHGTRPGGWRDPRAVPRSTSQARGSPLGGAARWSPHGGRLPSTHRPATRSPRRFATPCPRHAPRRPS